MNLATPQRNHHHYHHHRHVLGLPIFGCVCLMFLTFQLVLPHLYSGSKSRWLLYFLYALKRQNVSLVAPKHLNADDDIVARDEKIIVVAVAFFAKKLLTHSLIQFRFRASPSVFLLSLSTMQITHFAIILK